MTKHENLLEKVRECRDALISLDNHLDEHELPECLQCIDSFVKQLHVIEGWLLCLLKGPGILGEGLGEDVVAREGLGQPERK